MCIRDRAAREKARAVIAELREMKLKEAAKKVEDGIEETLTYRSFSFRCFFSPLFVLYSC